MLQKSKEKKSPWSELQTFTRADPTEEIDLIELWIIAWRGRATVLAFVLVFAAASVAYSLSLENIYEAKALLAPSDEMQGGGVSGIAGQLGGLASIAGIKMSGGGSNKVLVAIEVLRSRNFITEIIDQNNLLPNLMAVESWNPKSNELLYHPDVYDETKKVWVREVDPPKTPEPSSWEAYKVFADNMVVNRNELTGFVVLSVKHKSPYIAKQWVELLVKELNDRMRIGDITEAQNSIDYLKSQIDEINVADMRTVFYQLIEEQTKTIMLANARDEYVFKTIDPPVIAEEKIGPSRALICIIGTLLGGVISLIFIFVKHVYLKQKKYVNKHVKPKDDHEN